MATSKDKDDEDQFDGIAEGADTAPGKDKRDEDQFGGVAEAADNPDDDDATTKQDASRQIDPARAAWTR